MMPMRRWSSVVSSSATSSRAARGSLRTTGHERDAGRQHRGRSPRWDGRAEPFVPRVTPARTRPGVMAAVGTTITPSTWRPASRLSRYSSCRSGSSSLLQRTSEYENLAAARWIAPARSAKKGFATSLTTRPMVRVEAVRKALAPTCGRYPISRAARSTRDLVDSEIRGLPDNESDTVAADTPARSATSFMRTATPLLCEFNRLTSASVTRVSPRSQDPVGGRSERGRCTESGERPSRSRVDQRTRILQYPCHRTHSVPRLFATARCGGWPRRS